MTVMLSPREASASGAITDQDLRVLRRWFGWRDAPHALRQHFNEVAFAALRAREREISELRTAADWQRRQETVRQTLRTLFGPFPERTPLNARVTGVIQRPGYRIEKVVFESRPGLFVTGCVYLPDVITSRAPAILNPIGHTDIALRKESYQRLILHLVAKGFVVFPFDPVGQGERVQYFDPTTGQSRIGGPSAEHTHLGRQVFLTGRSSAHYFVWDGMRAIDYLVSRPDVDSERIGVTGLSGGGTQTAYIAAADERVRAAVPTCYITSFGRLLDSIAAQDAEQDPYGGIAAGIDYADFLEVRAPRPTLVVATTRDFFSIQGARETCAEASRAFTALGAPDAFAQFEEDFEHGYTRPMREAICGFFQRALDLPGDPTEPVEAQPVDPADLTVTETGQVATSLGGETVFSLNRVVAVELLAELETRRRDLKTHLPAVRGAAARLSVYHAPEDEGALDAVFAGRLHHADCAIEKVMLSGGGSTLTPALVLVPPGASSLSGTRAAVVVDPHGKAACLTPDSVALALVRRGWVVLAPDLSGRGELEHETRYYEPVLIGRSVPGVHATEIVRGARYLASRHDVAAGAVAVIGSGALGAAALHAAALHESLQPVALVDAPLSWAGTALNRDYTTDFSSVVPGALTAYDLPDVAACLAPRPLLVANPVDHLGEPVLESVVNAEWDVARRAYRGAASASLTFSCAPHAPDTHGTQAGLGARVAAWLEATAR